MSGRAVRGIRDVAEKNLCTGCGVCAFMQPGQIDMVDVLAEGRRPLVLLKAGAEPDTSDALAACPGRELAHDRVHHPDVIPQLLAGWGPVLEVWEGYAADEEIRYAGSSGGVATALALHCVDAQSMHGVLHIAARPDLPYLNHTVLSRTRAEMLAATGSRYAPASPGDGLQMVVDAPAPCVFIGKPCDVGGVAKARARRPELDAKLGLTIGIFCAGTPSTQGTLEMLKRMGADPRSLSSVRYRGNGWPGLATTRNADAAGTETVSQLTYDQSWGEILQKHRQWRCHVCLDHTGEFADIAVGDPWYKPTAGDPGRSMVLIRTERGRRILLDAIAAGVLVMERADPAILPASQLNLLRTRGAVWGRILTLRALGLATPRFRNMASFRFWVRELGWRDKGRSTVGTARRVRVKKLRAAADTTPYVPGFDPNQR